MILRLGTAHGVHISPPVNEAAISTELVGRTLAAWQRALAYAVLAGLVALAIWVLVAQPYTPGSHVGYNLGLVGGCMMLALLLHPLRKHWSRLHHVGTLRTWFIFHLIFGIGGPLLILFHSTFKLHSFNAAVAFWCMMLVVFSGAVGRYVYLHVYQEMGALNATLYAMEGRLDKGKGDSIHAFDLAPKVREWLDDYRRAALGARSNWIRKLFRMIVLRGGGMRLARRACAEIDRTLRRMAKRERWGALKLSGERQALEALITDYLKTVDAAVRYSFWERTFVWWHIVHGPVVIILALSAVAHVVAVHLY